jgi:DNA-binding SARP family transcriptional activator
VMHRCGLFLGERVTMPISVGKSRYRLLGPVRIAGHPAPPSPPKARALLALLVLRANQPVPYEDIARELWAAEPPASAWANVRTYVARLRAAGARVTATGYGYRLATDPHEIDVVRFRMAVARGRALRAAGNLSGAAEAFSSAAATWRGRALEDAPIGAVLQMWRTALEEERTAMAHDRADVLLLLGRHTEASRVLGPVAAGPPFGR